MIRQETAADAAAVRAVNGAAFGGDKVPLLVDALRAAPGYVPELALVAEDAGEVVGHTMLTRVDLAGTAGDRSILCLSPLAVRPDRQGAGLGRALVAEALARADRMGEPVVVLEGDPALYRRFGFVAAEELGLLRPSPNIPPLAFQAHPLAAYDPKLRGRVRYSAPFWAFGGAGLPEAVGADGIAWLFELARYAGWVETVTAAADLELPVPACPGWTVGDVLQHLGVIHRLVPAWLRDGRRPRSVAQGPSDGDVRAWYADGWRGLWDGLAAVPAEAPAASWSPWDDTAGFWRRRMVHEVAIHALDVFAAVPDSGPPWTATGPVALDGIDEALRLWLATQTGTRAGGSGGLVRIATGGREWTVGVHPHIVEVHTRPTPPDARIEGDPAAVYAWLWGRDAGSVHVTGDEQAVADLRRALTVAMQ
jgi:uncharacterized protein (TIGR03083 family)